MGLGKPRAEKRRGVATVQGLRDSGVPGGLGRGSVGKPGCGPAALVCGLGGR